MTTVGYGEIGPATPSGKLIAILTVFLGLFFFALPVTVVNHHFNTSKDKSKDRKSASKFETLLRARKREGVMNLLTLANKGLGVSLFDRNDELVFLGSDNQLNTKVKLEQILHFANGWSYLPKGHNSPDRHKLSQ